MEHARISLKPYVAGFVLSVILTLTAYFLVVERLLSGWELVAAIIALALTQFFVQVTLFLHVGDEPKPRWNLSAFLFMLLVVVIIVIGSLWIMNNLNYNMMMSPEEMETYMMKRNEKGF